MWYRLLIPICCLGALWLVGCQPTAVAPSPTAAPLPTAAPSVDVSLLQSAAQSTTADSGRTPLAASLPTAVPTATAEPQPTTLASILPNLGPAPEITNEVWLNTEAPLRLADLRGKVVLVEFWTFGCINCQRVIPHMNEWYGRFAGDAFEIISVHYPEFGYEEDVDNVQAALVTWDIAFPVAIDNDGQTWRAYKQRYWPTRYVVDKQGNIRYMHIGERGYEETAAVIEALMAEE